MTDKQFDMLMHEITGMKQEITGMKQEIAGTNEEVAGIKQEIAGTKQEVAGIKQEVSGIKQEIVGIKQRLDALEEGQKEIKNTIIEDRLATAKEFNAVRKEIRNGYQMATRQFLEIVKIVENRYQEEIDEREKMQEDIKTLHILAKKNDEDHKKINEILFK